MSVEPFFVTPAEAARLLAVHRNEVYKLCASGAILSLKTGKGFARRIVYADLKRYVREQLQERPEWGDEEKERAASIVEAMGHG